MAKLFYSANNQLMSEHQNVIDNSNSQEIPCVIESLEDMMAYIKDQGDGRLFYPITSIRDFLALKNEDATVILNNINTVAYMALSEHHAVIGCTRDGMTRRVNLSLLTDDELLERLSLPVCKEDAVFKEMTRRGIILDPMGGYEMMKSCAKKDKTAKEPFHRMLNTKHNKMLR